LVITEADREPIKSVAQFEEIVDSKKGDAILIKVVDDEGTSRYVGLEISK
jgi:S1-C subfamily serine protease